MWYDEASIYQIYPLGLCGAPEENDGVECPRILRLLDWVEHIKRLGCTAVMFNPLFESDRHGYDTRDYFRPDCRLGSKEDLKKVCAAFHEAGIKIIFDAVLNHVGRGFWAFKDVREKKWASPYKDWFNIWEGNTFYNDGFNYEGWEGHQELVKLNLRCSAVIEHQFAAVRSWVEDYGVDGLRLDVAYCLDRDYLKKLRNFTSSLKSDFLLLGESIHGDYRDIMNPEMCHSATNYECYKGLWSSFNSMNMFEIAHSLQRQFGREPWCLYTGKQLLSFLDNHDVERIASKLSCPEHIFPAFGLLFGMPGVPCVYYGSEWGIKGRKCDGDRALRPELERPEWNALTDFISRLTRIRSGNPALSYGDFETLLLTNRQFIFRRRAGDKSIIIGINADSNEFEARFNSGCGSARELISGELQEFSSTPHLRPFGVYFWEPLN